MTRQIIPISLEEEINNAITRVFEEKAKERKRKEAKGDTDDRWYADACYTTGQEIEREVRDEARRRTGNYSVRIMGLNGISLLHHCRDRLADLTAMGELKAFNFGKHCISGMRFYPLDVELPASTARTVEKQAKTKPIHFRVEGLQIACTKERKPKRTSWRSNRRSVPRGTTVPGEVTCKCCKNLLRKKVNVTETGPDDIVETIELNELVRRTSCHYDEADKLRGRFAPYDLSTFIVRRED
jgi:hypothetical protein